MADDKVLPQVREALEKDGWTLKPKAFSLRDSGYQFWIDVDGEKDGQRIVVEVKSWITTFTQDWYQAFGQYMTYAEALKRKNKDIDLYLAVPEDIYNQHFKTSLIQNMVYQHKIKLLIFNNSNSVAAWKQ